MNRVTALIFVLGFIEIAGCNFDEQRQIELQYPVMLIVQNATQKTINLKSIYSTVDIPGGFVLEGGKISPGSSLDMRISESTYEAMKNGKFVFEGVCGDIKEWKKGGETLSIKDSKYSGEWKISVSIGDCNP